MFFSPMLAPLFQQDPHLISRTLAESRELFATLSDVEKRLGTARERPEDLELAQQTAHRLRNRQVLLFVIRNQINYHDPEIEYLCQYVPHTYDAQEA
jgi:hypothetical protein